MGFQSDIRGRRKYPSIAQALEGKKLKLFIHKIIIMESMKPNIHSTMSNPAMHPSSNHWLLLLQHPTWIAVDEPN